MMMAGPVLLACVVIGVLAGGVRLATSAMADPAATTPPAAFLLINVLSTMIAAGFGGLLCTRRAPEGRVALSAGLLFVIFLAAGVLAGRALATPSQPLWFQATVMLLGASGLLVGLAIGAASRKKPIRSAQDS
jgi:hypothetical protein